MTTGVDQAATNRFRSAAVGGVAASADPPATGEEVRRRRPVKTLVALGVLLALAAGVLAGRAWDGLGMSRAWQVTGNLAPGKVLAAGDLRTVRVSRTAGDDLVDTGAPPVGAVLGEPVRAGSLLLRSELGPGPVVPAAGQVLIGVAAAAGLAPGGLVPGDHVRLVALPPAAEPGHTQPPARVLLGSASVQRVEAAAQAVAVTLVVPAKLATQVALLAAQDRLVLVGLPR